MPIPGTQTSLAIVGYAVSTAAEPARRRRARAAEPAHDTELDRIPDRTGPPGRPDAGGLLIDRVQRRVWTDDGEIPMTFQEFELLAFLSAHPAVVFSRMDLLERVWQPPAELDRRDVRAGSRTVDVHVSRPGASSARSTGSAWSPSTGPAISSGRSRRRAAPVTRLSM